MNNTPPDRFKTEPAPSRSSNPFATCWTHPGALQPLLPQAQTLEELAQRLQRFGWRGQIVGPHGAGKTTLLAALVARLPSDIRCFDGFDSMPLWRRCALRLSHPRIVVTSHREIGLPTLCSLAPTQAIAIALFQQLTAERPTRVTAEDCIASFQNRGGDLRAVWFDLYLLHELTSDRLRNSVAEGCLVLAQVSRRSPAGKIFTGAGGTFELAPGEPSMPGGRRSRSL